MPKSAQPRRTPPPAPFAPIPAAFSAEPFTATDIPFLARVAGVALVSGADHDDLAGRLGQAFREALDWVAMTAGSAPRGAALAFFEAVAKHAGALLQIIGLPTDPAAILAMSNDEIDMRPGMVRLRADGPGDFGEGTREIVSRLAQRGGVSAVSIPFGIARLHVLAEGAAGSLRTQAGRPGAPSDAFSEVLFNKLSWLHLDMFGILPVTDGNERGDRSGASVDTVAGCKRFFAHWVSVRGRVPDLD